MELINAFISAIKAGVSVKEALLAIVILLLHYHIFSQYKGRLSDRQKEIDRLAAENRQYRERFIVLMDKNFGIKRKPPKSNTTKEKK